MTLIEINDPQGWTQRQKRAYASALNELLARAREAGFTANLVTANKVPLTMGGYVQRIELDIGNELYRSIT